MKMNDIIEMRKNGATYQEIADAVGLSKQWVQQLITKHAPELKGTRGSARRRALDLINRQQAEIERYKDVIKLLEKDVQTAKAEAVKEFAERLKAIFNFGVRVYDGKCTVDGVVHNIDNLVKEMTEQSVNYGSSKNDGERKEGVQG